jgi:hypothetical protein
MTRSIDDVPSCGQENDYRRAARSSPGSERELAEKINLHLQLGKSGPGFHLSDDDLCMIVKALLRSPDAAAIAPQPVKPYTGMPGAMINGETIYDWLMDDGSVEAMTASDVAKRRATLTNAAQGTLKLGDIVQFNATAPYASEWRGAELKVVSLRMSPDGALWVSVIESEDSMAHRGHGYYDGETTDIPAEHLSPISSTEGK